MAGQSSTSHLDHLEAKSGSAISIQLMTKFNTAKCGRKGIFVGMGKTSTIIIKGEMEVVEMAEVKWNGQTNESISKPYNNRSNSGKPFELKNSFFVRYQPAFGRSGRRGVRAMPIPSCSIFERKVVREIPKISLAWT
jgi:hypothetical protein